MFYAYVSTFPTTSAKKSAKIGQNQGFMPKTIKIDARIVERWFTTQINANMMVFRINVESRTNIG